MMMKKMAKNIVPANVSLAVFPVIKKSKSINAQGKAAVIAFRRTG